jgi:hypothetical protein
LLYPEKHDLVITSDAEIFVVNLKIELEQRKEFFPKPAANQQTVYARSR